RVVPHSGRLAAVLPRGPQTPIRIPSTRWDYDEAHNVHARMEFCMKPSYAGAMSPTVQVRDLDEQTVTWLKEAAERDQLTLSAFLRRELDALAKRLDVRFRAGQLNEAPTPLEFGQRSPEIDNVSTQDVVDL